MYNVTIADVHILNHKLIINYQANFGVGVLEFYDDGLHVCLDHKHMDKQFIHEALEAFLNYVVR